jgi:DNA primase
MDQVEEIKSKVDIVQLVGEYVKLTRAGRNFKALCPFHGEKTPSFMVNPELQIFKCFGCGAGGDAFAFLQKIEGLEFGEALRALAKRTGVTLVSYTPTKGEEERERLFNINNLAGEFYHYLLTKHRVGEGARRYLKERKISDKAVETFRLGFAPEGWDYLIKYLVGKKRFNMEDLGRAGLVVDSKYDRFRNRVMFPLNNHRGQTVGFAGRVMPGGDEKTGKYINTPETEIYHKGDLLYGLDVNRAQIKKAGWAVVVEGEIDTIASWQAGVENVVAVKGSALTEKQVDLLRRLGDRIVLGMDADLAGGSAARRGIGIAEKAGLFVETVDWSLAGEGTKDVADVVSADAKKWQQMADKVISIYSFYIDNAIAKFGLSAEGKTRIANDVMGFLGGIGDEIRKDEYLKELSAKAGVEVEVLREQMGKTQTSNDKSANDKEETATSVKTRREVVEEYVVGLALRNDRVAQLTSPQVRRLFGAGFWKKVIDCCLQSATGNPAVKNLIKSMPAELKEKVQEQMLVELSPAEAAGDEERMDREWKKAVVELEEIGIREKIDNIQSGGKQEKQQEELLKLTRRLNELTRGK